MEQKITRQEAKQNTLLIRNIIEKARAENRPLGNA